MRRASRGRIGTLARATGNERKTRGAGRVPIRGGSWGARAKGKIAKRRWRLKKFRDTVRITAVGGCGGNLFLTAVRNAT